MYDIRMNFGREFILWFAGIFFTILFVFFTMLFLYSVNIFPFKERIVFIMSVFMGILFLFHFYRKHDSSFTSSALSAMTIYSIIPLSVFGFLFPVTATPSLYLIEKAREEIRYMAGELDYFTRYRNYLHEHYLYEIGSYCNGSDNTYELENLVYEYNIVSLRLHSDSYLSNILDMLMMVFSGKSKPDFVRFPEISMCDSNNVKEAGKPRVSFPSMPDPGTSYLLSYREGERTKALEKLSEEYDDVLSMLSEETMMPVSLKKTLTRFFSKKSDIVGDELYNSRFDTR